VAAEPGRGLRRSEGDDELEAAARHLTIRDTAIWLLCLIARVCERGLAEGWPPEMVSRMQGLGEILGAAIEGMDAEGLGRQPLIDVGT
jgi:hypothetical protein